MHAKPCPGLGALVCISGLFLQVVGRFNKTKNGREQEEMWNQGYMHGKGT